MKRGAALPVCSRSFCLDFLFLFRQVKRNTTNNNSSRRLRDNSYFGIVQTILLISDTHTYLDKRLYKYINSVDEVWHAGDIGTISLCNEITKLKPLRAVYGNIDGKDIRKVYSKNAIFLCEGVKVFITHIGGYPNKYTPDAKTIILQEKPALFICGHSHILKIMFDKQYNLLHLNPGSCGMQGFHLIRTALRFAIQGTEIKNMEIIELGKRA